MGDAQSAQREGKKDAAAEDESGKVDDAQAEQNTEDKPFKNNGQIAEINGKADSSIAEGNGPCEDKIAAEAILSSDEDVSQTEKPLKEDETPLKNVEINEKESPNEADANEDVPLEMIEMDTKQNDINESFRRFFSNIGLKLTVKRGSGEIPTNVPDKSNKEEPNKPEDTEDTAKETKSEHAEQNTDVNIAQETYDNDSTTCPTLTDITSEDVLENAEEKTTETKEEVESDNADAAKTSPVGEDTHQEATPEEEPNSTSPSSPDEEQVVSPIKRFFTTGIFSGLRKKRKPAEDEKTAKELVDMGKKEVVETTEQTVQDQQPDKEEISQAVEAAAFETEHKENELDEGKSPSMDPSTIIVTESEIMSSQEKDKIQASPLKRLLSGSSLKKLSKKQRSRKSSDAKLSDSGEHVADQLLSSTESAENQKEEGPAQPSAEAAEEEDGAWATFKKLVTPKKRMKRPSLSSEETQIPGSVEEPKPSEGEQISDHSTEEGKKRKDSSVSWEAVLCGSGRRRSRKTSDSEDETPQIDNNDNKQGGGSKHGAESLLESSNQNEILASSPKQAGSPSEGDGGSTWKSLKKLVTPKRKAKDEDESKDNVQSDSEVTQDESSFSIKKLLPGRKKRKSAEKHDQVSSDEADKDLASGDEDSDTPAVVPMSEYDTVETEVHIQIQADVESRIPDEADYDLQQDLLDQMAEPVLPCDSLQTEAKKVKDNDDALEKQASTTLATNEEPDDLTESISNHQQLSDIPEEGIITETMATPASPIEEPARDDTIAEDLIEITSEAITAPEPASDITLTDETEMISAVSQLSSESSKTSGNTTPVPAEYDVMETDVLLHQVVETMSIIPKAVPVCSEELNSERIVVSVSHQILETFVKEPTILEIHRLDASAINTSLNVEEPDAINELVTTAQTESISEVNDSVSTDIISEVPTEEFDTAEIAVDEVHEVSFTHPEGSVKELESIDDSYCLVECLSEVNAAASTDILPEGEEMLRDEGSLVEAHQAETEPTKTDSQEAGSAATEADETKDAAMEEEVQTLTEKEDQIMHNITDQIQVEDKDQSPVEVQELQELAAVQAATLDSEERSVQSLEKESEDIPAAETVTYESKEETVPLTEFSVDPEKEDELETDAAKTDHVKVPEPLEGSVQSPEEEVKSEDIPSAEAFTDEPRQTAEHLTEVSVEPENKELPVNAVKTEHDQEPEVLQAVQSATLDLEAGSLLSLEKEVMSEDISALETVTDEPKQEIEVRVEPEEKLPVNAVKTEHDQEPEVLEAVQSATLDLEAGSLLSLEKEVMSEDISALETVTDEPKQEIEVRVEPEEKLPVEGAKTEHVQEPEVLQAVQSATLDLEAGSLQSLEKEVMSEDIPAAETFTDEPRQTAEHLTEVSVEPENKELPVNAVKTEHVQEPEVLEVVQAPTLDSEDGSVQSLEKEVISEDIPSAETVTDEPKEETVPLIEVNFEQVDASNTEHVQEPEVLQAVQSATLNLEAGSLLSLEKEVTSEDISALETVTDEPKQEIEVRVEPEEKLPVEGAKTEHVQEPEVLQAVQSATLDLEAGSLQSLEKEVMSEDIPTLETVTDEPKEETVPLIEVNLQPVDASNTEHVQEPEVLQAVQSATLDLEAGSLLSLEKEVTSKNISALETVTDEPKQEIEVRVEPEEKLPVEGAKTEHVQEPEVLQAVQSATLDLEAGSLQSLEKEVMSEDISALETVTDEPKQEIEVRVEPEEKLPVEGAKTEHVQEPEVLQAVQSATLDLEAGSLQSLEKEVMSEDISALETVTDEPKQEIEVRVEPEEKLPVEGAKTEHVQEPEVLQAVQSATLDLEAGSLQSLEKEVISEDISALETVTDEPKQTAEQLTEVSVEPENKELPVNAVKTEHVQEPEVLEAVQAPTLDSEDGSVQSLEKEVISEDIPSAETVTDEPRQTEEHLTEVSAEPENKELQVNAVKTEHVQEPEVLEAVQAPTLDSEAGSLLSLDKEVTSEDISALETVIDEPKEEIEVRVEPEEKLPVEGAKTEHVQEPEVLPSDVKYIVNETKTEEGASMYVHVVTESIEGGSAQEFEQQIMLEDVPKPDADNVITSVTHEIESEVVAQLDQALEITGKQKTESIPQDVEQQDCIPEVVDELQTLTAAHVSSIKEEASNVGVLEKTVISEETPAPCADNAAVTDEPKHEVHLSAVQVSIEGEKESELPSAEIKTAAVEHAVVAQLVICNVKEVLIVIPEALTEKTSHINEPLIDSLASELVFKEAVVSAAPLVKDDVTETAEEGSVVVMMHAPSVKLEDNHRIQVQVVDVDIKSAETIVDSALQVGVTEVIDVCHETVKKVDHLSATPGIAEELINEEDKVTIQDVIQHVKENLPETVPEPVVVNFEQEVIKQPDAVTEVSELVESESNEVKDQEAMEDSIGTFRGRQDEAHAVISDDSVSEDLMQTPDIPGSLDVSIFDHKEDLEETKAERETSEAGVTAEEVKSSSEEFNVKPSNTEFVVPQNTGIISSIGHVESPSSLLEFKRNIQLGQAKAPAPPSPTTERTEPMKQADSSEVRVQAGEPGEAVEPLMPINPTQRAEVAVQVTEVPEPAASLASTERAVITTQPALLDMGIHAMEKVEPVEETKSTERVTSIVQATETIQPERQTDKREVLRSQPVLSEACDQETKADEPVKQIEEEKENDQDVWMDAVEVIYTQKETEVSLLEVEESLEPPTESYQEDKAALEVEMAPNPKTEEEESQQEMHKTGETCTIESEGEEFAVAPEHHETATESITTMELD